MIPAILVDGLLCGLFVLVVTKHVVAATGDNLTRDIGRIVREDLYFHTVDGLATAACHKFFIVAIRDEGCTLSGAIAYSNREIDAQ